MRKIWKVREQDVEKRKRLSECLRISEITSQILLNRGIGDPDAARAFLACRMSSSHHPNLLKDIEKAVRRIKKAVSRGERILVYGDYDVDGITGVTLLYSTLRSLGGNAEYYIPNRLEEGYGLNLAAMNAAHKRKVSLIVTVDCGITSFREIEYANRLKIDVIVTDHHELSDGGLPNAYSVINPLRHDCRYPFKHLSGVGLAYKLASLLLEGTNHVPEDFLDLVALGTVADIVPQVDENRILTKHGLFRLNRTRRPGLRALIEVAGLNGRDISIGHIGFILGPRINAMGRIGSPEIALRLLLTDDDGEARDLAKILDTENRKRQRIEAQILNEAIAKVEREVNFKHHRVIVLESANWHPGVIGIVASRIAERFYRPTILISTAGKVGKGSGRSIQNFHLFEALLKCREHLLGFGGHECACGVTIEKGKIAQFRDAINELASHDMKEEDLLPKLDIDMEVPLGALKEDVLDELENLSPFGPENPRPVLSSSGLVVKDIPRLIGKSGFKLLVTDGKSTCEAVSFGRQEFQLPQIGSTVDLAYIPAVNTWQGIPSLQLELKDIK
jgi:single-stranded-DNA-specific exonuclease